MIDCIEREAAIRAVTAENLDSHVDSVMDGAAKRYHRAVERVLTSIPAADVAPVVHGRWKITTQDDGFGTYRIYRCDKCGAFAARQRNYCHNCGAKMDKEGADYD